MIALSVGSTALMIAVFLVAACAGVGRNALRPASASGSTCQNTGSPSKQHGNAALPIQRSLNEAAVRYGWPLLWDDEFTGTCLDQNRWRLYSGNSTGGVGEYMVSNVSTSRGILKITSHGDQSGGMAWRTGQRYGRWEIRVKAQSGNGYSPVVLLWPDAEDWPEGGEIDFMEMPGGDRKVNYFTLHYGKNDSQNEVPVSGDFTQWHNYAVEWAPNSITGFIDGRQIFNSTDKSEIPKGSMHLAIQQDIGPFNNWVPAQDATTPPEVQLRVDWVRIYGP